MATQIAFRNPSTTHSVKLVYESAVMVKDPKDEKAAPRHNGQWKAAAPYIIVKPNEQSAFFVGPGRRVRVEELPT